MEKLDRDPPPDQHVLREEHRAHAAIREPANDPVPPVDDVVRMDSSGTAESRRKRDRKHAQGMCRNPTSSTRLVV
jgi:hypothetical protein